MKRLIQITVAFDRDGNAVASADPAWPARSDLDLDTFVIEYAFEVELEVPEAGPISLGRLTPATLATLATWPEGWTVDTDGAVKDPEGWYRWSPDWFPTGGTKEEPCWYDVDTNTYTPCSMEDAIKKAHAETNGGAPC